jgi:hypothetical protein
MHHHTSCISWTPYSCRSWTSFSWFLLTTYLYIQIVRMNMKSICGSCSNDYETISFMQSLASVSSALMKCHSWAMWYHRKESLWAPARWEMSWIGSRHSLFTKRDVCLGWLAIIEGLFRTSSRSQSLSPSCWRRVTNMCRARIVMKPFWLWRSC